MSGSLTSWCARGLKLKSQFLPPTAGWLLRNGSGITTCVYVVLNLNFLYFLLRGGGGGLMNLFKLWTVGSSRWLKIAIFQDHCVLGCYTASDSKFSDFYTFIFTVRLDPENKDTAILRNVCKNVRVDRSQRHSTCGVSAISIGTCKHVIMPSVAIKLTRHLLQRLQVCSSHAFWLGSTASFNLLSESTVHSCT
jgi:hypothetical protein